MKCDDKIKNGDLLVYLYANRYFLAFVVVGSNGTIVILVAQCFLASHDIKVQLQLQGKCPVNFRQNLLL